MHLHFNREKVEKLLNHAEETKRHNHMYRSGHDAEPALWLIGDDGIYLMSNGEPTLPGEDTTNFVCYADECNPKTMDFDTWWQNKQLSFGGDDGAESCETSVIRYALSTYGLTESLILDVTPTNIGLIAYRTVLTPKPFARRGPKKKGAKPA